jgi:DNA helicase-2/ATP-dependent DNA helicase PcrA
MPDREDGRSTWEEIEEADTDRYRLLHALTASVDLARRGLFDVAIQELVKAISSRKAFRAPLKHADSITMTSRRAVALSLIEYMAAKHDEMARWTTLEVYRGLTDHVPTCLAGLSMTKATKGMFVDQSSTSKYRDLIDSVATADETRLHRTIHQAKGAEADAVFVSLDGDEWKHILSPKAGVEEQRIAYVALSRAKVDLFIHTPDRSTKDKFAAMGLTVVDIGPSGSQEAEERSSV